MGLALLTFASVSPALTVFFGLALFVLLLKYLEQGDVVRDLRVDCRAYRDTKDDLTLLLEHRDEHIEALQAQIHDVQGWLAEGRLIVIPGSRADEG